MRYFNSARLFWRGPISFLDRYKHELGIVIELTYFLGTSIVITFCLREAMHSMAYIFGLLLH